MTIDKILKDFMHNKGISQTRLAEKLGESRQNLRGKIQKKSIDTDYLAKISIALEHDFFSDLSNQLPFDIRAKQSKPRASKLDEALIELIQDRFPNLK